MCMRRPSQYLSISEVARRVGVSSHCLSYHISKGAVPPPVAFYGNSRYYLPSDVPKIREFIRNRRPAGCSRWSVEDLKRIRELWESGVRQSQIAQEFGTTQATISSLLTGRVRAAGAERAEWKPRRRNTGV